jgi:transcriptional regulator with XRE-family HTH domain
MASEMGKLMIEMAKTNGFRLTELRKRANMTQKQLLAALHANGCGISYSTLRKVEGGRPVKREYVQSVCDFLHADMESASEEGCDAPPVSPLVVALSLSERASLLARARSVGLTEQAFAKQVILCACGNTAAINHAKAMLRVAKALGSATGVSITQPSVKEEV